MDYLPKPVPRCAPSPLPVLYFTVRSQEVFLLPSTKKGKEGKKRKKKKKSCLHAYSHQEGIEFGLCSAFCYNFVWRDVCFGRGSGWHAGAAAGSFSRGRVGTGSFCHPAARRAVPSPQVASGGEALSSTGCRGLCFAFKWRDFGAGARWWQEQRAQRWACEKASLRGATSRWQGDEARGLIGLFHFNFYSKMTLCYCSQTRRQPSLKPHTRSFLLFCP